LKVNQDVYKICTPENEPL